MAATEKSSASTAPNITQESTPALGRHSSRLRKVLTPAAVLVILLGGVLAWLARSLPPPRVLSTSQITHDGVRKVNVLTDGSRLYIAEHKRGYLFLVQASVAGGDTAVIPTPFADLFASAISADHSQLLAVSWLDRFSDTESQFWTVPIPTGTPRHLADVVGHFGTWSPDGRLLAFGKGTEIYLADADGSNTRKLITVSGRAWDIRFSPDGTRLRFTLRTLQSHSASIWEVQLDGSGLHAVLPNWHAPPSECCGEWSSDGRYYFFVSDSGQQPELSGTSNIWALRERAGLFARKSGPFQLTTGPMSMPNFVPSPDNKKIFAAGYSPRGQLVRYDNQSHQFLPFFGGISAGEMEFSRDGHSRRFGSLRSRSGYRRNLLAGSGFAIMAALSPRFWKRRRP